LFPLAFGPLFPANESLGPMILVEFALN